MVVISIITYHNLCSQNLYCLLIIVCIINSSNTTSQLSPATATSVPRPTPPPPQATLGMHSFPPPMFTAPLPPPVSSASPHPSLPTLPPPTTNPIPFSAESLFQSSKFTQELLVVFSTNINQPLTLAIIITTTHTNFPFIYPITFSI